MKTKLFSAFILFAVAQVPFNVFAQCNPSVPNNANVVSISQTVNGGFTPQWVCSGDTLISDGGIFFVYLEAGAVMNTGGGIDSIYVKDGATLNMNGGIHVILHEPLAVLNILGGIPAYYPCSVITFDYSNAPSSGCFITSALENAELMSVSISPNPATNELVVWSPEFPARLAGGGDKIELIEIYDVMGRKVFPSPLSSPLLEEREMRGGVIDVSSLSTGIYFVKAKTNEGIGIAKFVKE